MPYSLSSRRRSSENKDHARTSSPLEKSSASQVKENKIDKNSSSDFSARFSTESKKENTSSDSSQSSFIKGGKEIITYKERSDNGTPSPTQQSFDGNGSTSSPSSSSQQESCERHSNFWKKENRLDASKKALDFATKAERYSRYFLKRPASCEKFTEMEVPYYYYTTVNHSHSSSESTKYDVKGSSEYFNNGSKLDLNENMGGTVARELRGSSSSIVYEGNNDDIDEKPSKKKPFYKKFKILEGRRTSQIIAVLVVIATVIVGTVTYTSIKAWQTFRKQSPEVVEILSPYSYPQLSAIRTSLIDPDTPKEFHQKQSLVNNEKWNLVFSDEFNAEGRTFYEGEDQFFTAMDFHYAATNDLEYYVPDMIQTKNGTLNIKLDEFPTNGLDYRSGMLQSWNKLCFNKRALVEVSLKLPGTPDSRGLWPAVWSLGNLARPGYQATTDGVWPYTYDVCDYGITPNQSSTDGISFLPGQRLSKCTCYGEEHPNLGSGRGAPEIDILEGSHIPGDNFQYGVQTLQVAPFDPWWRPDYDYMAIHDQESTFMKPDTGTPTQEAIASMSVLNTTWFEDHGNPLIYHNTSEKSQFQIFGFEMMSETGDDSETYLQFYAGDKKTLGIYGDALHPQGNVGWRQLSKEPMSLIFNLGLSSTWSDIDFSTISFPVTLQIDYIRIYQPEGYMEMTCDPEDFPTTDYIEKHMKAYSNANFSSWEEAGFNFPKNSLMHGCSAPFS